VSVFGGLDDGDDFVGLVRALGCFAHVLKCRRWGTRFGGWTCSVWLGFGCGFGFFALLPLVVKLYVPE
jgi:hypothetical protein